MEEYFKVKAKIFFFLGVFLFIHIVGPRQAVSAQDNQGHVSAAFLPQPSRWINRDLKIRVLQNRPS